MNYSSAAAFSTALCMILGFIVNIHANETGATILAVIGAGLFLFIGLITLKPIK